MVEQSTFYGLPVIETELLPDGEIRIVSVIKDIDSLELRQVVLKGIASDLDRP